MSVTTFNIYRTILLSLFFNKEKIKQFNEFQVKDALANYSPTMDDYLKNSNKTFLNPQEFIDQHLKVKETAMNNLKWQLIGSYEFTLPFMLHLLQVINDAVL